MTDSIAFTEEYQARILALMLSNSEFKFALKGNVEVEHFGNNILQFFFDKLNDDEVIHTTTTLKEELMQAVKSKIIKEDEIPRYVEVFNDIKKSPTPHEETHIKDSVSKFIKTQAVKQAVIEALDLMKQGSWDQIAENMTIACGSGISDTDGGHRYASQHYDRLLRRANMEYMERISTGVPELDECLGGGIEPAQLGLVAGGTGRGKSLFLQWITKTALLLGKKVVYFTLELSEDAMASRFDSMLSNVKFNEVRYQTPAIKSKMEELHARFGDSLVIKEYPEDTATIHTLRSFIMRLQATGFNPDLVIVDYLDLLKPHRVYRSTHEELDSITKALRGLAKQMKTRIWTASQLNRAGIVMENPDETAMAGSVGKLYTVDMAIYMAQTSEERQNNIMRLIVRKNRNGMAEKSIKIVQDYSYMSFYKEAWDSGEIETEEISIDDDEAFIE